MKVKLYILFYIYFLAVVVVVAAAAGCSVAMYKGHWKKLLIFFTVVGLGLGVVVVRMVGWLVGWFMVVGWYTFYTIFLYIPYLLPSSLVKKYKIQHTFFFCCFLSPYFVVWLSLYVYTYFVCFFGSWLSFILEGICVLLKNKVIIYV